MKDFFFPHIVHLFFLHFNASKNKNTHTHLSRALRRDMYRYLL